VLVIAASSLLRAEVHFLTPEAGAQVFGRMPLEVATATANVDRVEFYVDGTLAGVARVAPYRMMFDFGESPASHRVVARVFSDQYRREESAEVLTAALTASESLDVDLVEVPFRAVTRKPRLEKSDISIRENGLTHEVREVLTTRGSTSFYFVIDRSLSMRKGKLTRALAAVDQALSRLRPADDASIILFNHRVESARTISRGEVAARYRDVTPSGGTSMRDAVASIQPQRRSIAIVISDGADRNSSMTTAAALQKVAQSKLTVYSLLLGGGSGADFLGAAADRTGGTAVSSSAERVAADLGRIMDDINSRYVAVYQSRGTTRGWREIQLIPRSGIQIATSRRGYYAE
jgi:hypothetical protein